MKTTSRAVGLLVSPAIAIGVLVTGMNAAVAATPKSSQVTRHDWDHHRWGHRGWRHHGWGHHGWRHHHHWYR